MLRFHFRSSNHIQHERVVRGNKKKLYTVTCHHDKKMKCVFVICGHQNLKNCRLTEKALSARYSLILPVFIRPPLLPVASSIRTWWKPAFTSFCAAAIPAIPHPMITTFASLCPPMSGNNGEPQLCPSSVERKPPPAANKNFSGQDFQNKVHFPIFPRKLDYMESYSRHYK